ncbi:MAG: TMEM165/GDT1 family protein, partial [Clostridia bacterium]|nr:TMEM165/GDT1 family protein [Clostridia bacterium]
EENRVTRFGPIMTVAIAFFIAELGDKTQLATIALATQFPKDPAWVLLGTTTGMLIADGIGIAIGVVMCKRIPEKTIKLVSAAVFILFGFISSFEVLTASLKVSLPLALGLLAIVAAITGFVAYKLIKNREDVEMPDFCRLPDNEETASAKNQ